MTRDRAGWERRVVAVTTLCASGILVIHGVLWDVVRHRNGHFVAHAGDLVAIGSDKASLFRLALVADMLDYLLLVPAAVYLWSSLRTRDAWIVDAVSSAGLAFAIVGATGAAALAAAGEPLIRRYAHAAPERAHEIATTFAALSDAVVGMWQLAGGVLLGAWLLGVGSLLRARWPWFAWYSLVLGGVALLAVAGLITGLDYSSDAPASAAFFPLAVWMGWLGALLWRGPLVPPAVGDAG